MKSVEMGELKDDEKHEQVYTHYTAIYKISLINIRWKTAWS